MKIWEDTIIVHFNTILSVVLFFYSSIHLYFGPVLWGEVKLLSFLTQTRWVFSLISFTSRLFKGWTQLSS